MVRASDPRRRMTRNELAYRKRQIRTRAQREIVSKVGQGFARNMRTMIRNAVGQGVVGGSERVVVQLAAAFENRVGTDGDLRYAHEGVARYTQAVLLESYRTRVLAQRLVAPYQRESRLSGALGAVLADPRMVEATADGIRYLDFGLLDEKAAHWRRLNWGTVPANTPSPSKFPVRFGNVTLTYLGTTAGPRRGFAIPKGFFSGPGPVAGGGIRRSVDRFYAVGPTQMKFTRGIVGVNYVDAGFEAMAQRLPQAWGALLNHWFAQAGAVAQSMAVASSRTVKAR